METTLIPVSSVDALQLFTGESLDALLDRIRAAATAFVPNVATPDGRKEIASMAYKVARSKTTIDEAGKKLVAEWKAKAASVDGARKKARDYLDALRDEVRAPLTEYEAEQQRIAEAEIERVRLENEEKARIEAEERARREAELAAREQAIAQAEAAAKAREAAVAAERERQAREQAELERARERARIEHEREMELLRREAEDAKRMAQEAREREERARVDEAKRQERVAAEMARATELARLETIAKAEREKAEKEAKEAAERAAREADEHHRSVFNGDAIDAFVAAGIGERVAKKVVGVIAAGLIPHVTITY